MLLSSCLYSSQKSSKLQFQSNIPKAMRHHGECHFLKWLTWPCVFYNLFKKFKKKELFLIFITTLVICISSINPSWVYSWFFGKYLCVVIPTTHKATGTKVTRPQQCLGPCLNTWPSPRSIHCTENNSNKRTRLKGRPSGIGTQICGWLAIWPWTSHLCSCFLHLKPNEIGLDNL